MPEETNAQVQGQATEQPTPAAPTGPTLTVEDLRGALQIMDVAVERKAFGGWGELKQIMTVRDKFESFIAAVTPAETPDATKKPAQKAASKKKK